MEGNQWGGGGGMTLEKGTVNKKHKWQVQNRQGEVKNSIGNGEAKELTCMTHGHETMLGRKAGRKGARAEGNGGWNGTTVIA